MLHSSTSAQVALSPVPDEAKPLPQEHEYPPELFVQVFVPEAPSSWPHVVVVAHSSTSTHDSESVPLFLTAKPLPQVQS